MLSELIRDQIVDTSVMFAAGIGVTFMYQIFGWACRVFIKRKPVAAAAEIAFWAGAAVFTGKFLYYCDYGQISGHTICAFAMGVILWKVCFCDIIYKICTFLEDKWDLKREHGKEETKQSI